jgi:hypothetical protein
MESVAPAAVIVKVRFTLADSAGLLASVTLNVSGELLTTAVGLPAIAPVAALRDKPAGSVPLVSDHVYGAVPPVAPNVAEYAVFTWPFARLVVVIETDFVGSLIRSVSVPPSISLSVSST